jgi:predicted transcriptional regulator
MMREARRIGRPMKAPARGKRVSLGLKVRAEVKQRIDSAARATGRTQSQEAEALIEQALTYNTMLSAMNTSMQEIAKGNIEAAFRKAGYTAAHSSHGKIWVPQGYPMPRSGFIDQETEQ